VEHVSDLITQKLESMVKDASSDQISSKYKAINALLPYAISLEQDGHQKMIDAIFRAAMASKSKEFMWCHVVLYISRLFEERSPTSLNRVIVLTAPYVPWKQALNNPVAVARWAAAFLAIPHTEEINQSALDALIRISLVELLRPHIPIEIWRWLKEKPSLPPVYCGEMEDGHQNIIVYIRRLGDIEILTSYFLIIWLDRFFPSSSSCYQAECSIKEDFGEAGAEGHRQALVERLDQLLEQLDAQLEHPEQHNPQISEANLQKAKKRYAKLKAAFTEDEK
jgi:hypothetical protein